MRRQSCEDPGGGGSSLCYLKSHDGQSNLLCSLVFQRLCREGSARLEGKAAVQTALSLLWEAGKAGATGTQQAWSVWGLCPQSP